MKDLEELDALAEEINEDRTEVETVVEDGGDDAEEHFLAEEDESAVDPELEGEETETIVVDGEEREESVEELLEAGKRAKQKELAADAKFQQAAKLQGELEARVAHMEQLEAELAKQREKVQEASSEEFSEALLMDEKKAGEMFAQTIAKQRELEERLASMGGELQQVNRVAEMQVRNQGAEFSRYYQDKYGDVAGNDGLHKIAMDRAKAIRAENQNLSEFEVIDQSVQDTRDWVKSLTGGDNATDKKRKMQKQPVKAGGRTRGKPAFKPETREDVLAQMQAAKAFS